jgi:hypothetical protein
MVAWVSSGQPRSRGRAGVLFRIPDNHMATGIMEGWKLTTKRK